MAASCEGYHPVVFLMHGSTFMVLTRRRVYILLIHESAGGARACKLATALLTEPHAHTTPTNTHTHKHTHTQTHKHQHKHTQEIIQQRQQKPAVSVQQVMLPEDDHRVVAFLESKSKRTHQATTKSTECKLTLWWPGGFSTDGHTPKDPHPHIPGGWSPSGAHLKFLAHVSI